MNTVNQINHKVPDGKTRVKIEKLKIYCSFPFFQSIFPPAGGLRRDALGK